MGPLLTPETFEFFAKYLLAGFIIFSVRGYYILGERPKQTEIFFEVIVLSLINQFVFLALSWLFSVMVAATGIDPIIANVATVRLPFFLEVLVLPVFIGLTVGLNLKRGWNEALLRRLSMPVVQPTRRAYDHLFGELRRESFLIVTYEDGTTVYGF